MHNSQGEVLCIALNPVYIFAHRMGTLFRYGINGPGLVHFSPEPETNSSLSQLFSL